jgi:predicted RNase H-like HicB family nuclease
MPRLPGRYTQGETREELESNRREAIARYLSDKTPATRVAEAEQGTVRTIAL